MKNLLYFPLFVFALFAVSANAQKTCKQTDVEIAKSVSKAFVDKNLGSLDTNRLSKTAITVKIENSLVGDGEKGQFVNKSFKSLKAAENWFTKREIDELPGRNTFTFTGCKKGICNFKSEGLLHNNLYFKQVTLGYTKEKCPYIKSIYIIDGN